MKSIASTRAADAIARRVTISLAVESPTFKAEAGADAVEALRKVKANAWKFADKKGKAIVPRKQLMAIETALAKVDEKLPFDFVFPGQVLDNRARSESTCDLCGEQHLRFLFTLRNKEGEPVFKSVGSSCIYTYLYNALGVETSEEAKAVLATYTSALIRLAQSVEFAREHPHFREDWKILHNDLDKLHRRYRSDYKLSHAVKDCFRTMSGKHGYATSSKKIVAMAERTLTHALKNLSENDPFVQDLKFAIDNEIGYITDTRSKQIYEEWPVLVVDKTKEIEDLEKAYLERKAREREDRINLDSHYYNEILGKNVLTEEEKVWVEKLVAERIPKLELSYDDRIRIYHFHERTTLPVKAEVKEETEAPRDPTAPANLVNYADITSVLEKATTVCNNGTQNFAKSLLSQLKRKGSLSQRQLEYIIGDDNGLNPNHKPALRTAVLSATGDKR